MRDAEMKMKNRLQTIERIYPIDMQKSNMDAHSTKQNPNCPFKNW